MNNTINEENVELNEAEVNTYTSDCGKIKVHCLNDCPFSTPWITTDW